ncbi:hypothetical protein DICTH_0234 [Dictyoglomus thermophilum H-6-12]|uniref:Uncharacterized protein n=1 Tax=Dictyoglomus thermophilum (strain ATCC 35947 / DSM 3960 / H-6-12) TaxID=309799 RepID=B5YC09_DICT6|nr:hypothetical protein DICTH_0234 [Dictyoglomus thermophilum H-6-12]
MRAIIFSGFFLKSNILIFIKYFLYKSLTSIIDSFYDLPQPISFKASSALSPQKML